MSKEGSSAKSRLLGAASELFYTQGIRSVGTKKLVKKAGTAYMSLYNNFKGKDGLVIAYLKDEEEGCMKALNAAIENQQIRGIKKIITGIDSLIKRWKHGDAHTNALVEYPDPNHQIHREAINFRQRLRKKLTDMLEEASLDQPKKEGIALELLSEIDCLHISALYDRLPRNPNIKASVQKILGDTAFIKR